MWLKAHCESKPETLGYAVLLDLTVPGKASLRYTRLKGEDQPEVVEIVAESNMPA